MNVLLIGSGGREHALALKISQSRSLTKLFIYPGNPGTNQLGQNIEPTINDENSLINFCHDNKIKLVVVGPEKPLIDGLADKLILNGIKVFGPTKAAARLEGEKSFAKNLMKEYGIPTADYEVFTKDEYFDALEYLKTSKPPVVIKADGIAAGKGVMIAANFEEAKDALEDCFVRSTFGASGNKVVIEEFMTGQEASIFAITDGIDYILLPAAQDHKRIGEGDTGKNTGGMGAYAPTPFVTDVILDQVALRIVEPTLKAMRDKFSMYSGCLYVGLMLTEDGPKVVEYNCRFGDPETQVVLPLLEGDFLELLYSVASGELKKRSVKYNGGASVCVVAASKGYPDAYEKGKEIFGLEEITSDEMIIYHAGTAGKEGKIVTNGGRVLGATSIINENNLIKAKETAYKALSKIHFDGIYYRKDISDKATKNLD
ncbi:MAG: phosphoribosylamine--glycine ligase [Bacteroidota bacterium]